MHPFCRSEPARNGRSAPPESQQRHDREAYLAKPEKDDQFWREAEAWGDE